MNLSNLYNQDLYWMIEFIEVLFRLVVFKVKVEVCVCCAVQAVTITVTAAPEFVAFGVIKL